MLKKSQQWKQVKSWSKQGFKLGSIIFILLLSIFNTSSAIAATTGMTMAANAAATAISAQRTSTAKMAEYYGKFFETRDITFLLDMIDKKTLVIFDIDNTIFRTKTLLGSPEWAVHVVNQEMSKGKDCNREACCKKCYPLWMKAQKYTDIVLLDKKILPVLKEVRKKSCGFIGLTSRQPAAAEITEWQLNKFGIDFGRSRFSIFKFMPSCKYPTLFRQGILFSGNFNKKGEVLAAWVEQLQAHINQKNAIKKIIVIDHQAKNLQSMAAVAQRLGLEFTGCRYSVIDSYKKKINPALIEKEKEILMNNLADSETRLFLENAGSYKDADDNLTQEELEE